jgi:hypothetical protein
LSFAMPTLNTTAIGDNPFLVDLRFLQHKVPQFVMIHLKVLV